MKIICIEGCFDKDGERYITLRPDTSILRENDDFYIPSFSSDIVCGGGLTVRINRLAKSLDSRFAGRCYDSVGVGMAFLAKDVMAQAIAAGYPCDEAYCFDRSLAVSPDTVSVDVVMSASITISVGGEQRMFRVGDMLMSIDECISRASRLVTLKTGDIIYIGMSADMRPKMGDEIKICINDCCMLDFSVR